MQVIAFRLYSVDRVVPMRIVTLLMLVHGPSSAKPFPSVAEIPTTEPS